MVARWRWPFALAACVAAAGFASVASRLDVNWDLKNYHLYNAYAFLNGRLGWDIAPAQLQTYHNPLLDLPFYYLVQAIPSPRVIAFVMASTAGVAAFCLLRILAALFPKGFEDRALWIALAFIAGMTGSMGRSVIGSTMNEWPPAMLMMLSLAILVAPTAARASPRARDVALASLLTGFAVGLKLTYGVFGAGLAISLAAFGTPRERLRRALLGGVFLFAGFLATYGFWGATLYREFASPFFPYFNDLFRSPWAEPVSLVDPNYGPRNALQAMFFPLYFARESRLVSEVSFRDWRLATLFVLAFLALARWLWSRRHGDARAPRELAATGHAWQLLGAFTLASYLAWLALFGIYRYLVPLEMLSAPLIVGCVLYIVPGRNARRALVVILVALLVGTTRTANWGRLDFRGAYFDVAVPDLAPRALVIMGYAEPMSYAIAFARPDARFVYPWNNFLQYDQHNLMAERARSVIGGHREAIYSMAFENSANLTKLLDQYGLERDARSCLPIRSYLDTSAIRLCRVYRKEDRHDR
ncbi:MAG TPA: hypothetical protein VF386_12265 [Usitatibacter sp.]